MEWWHRSCRTGLVPLNKIFKPVKPRRLSDGAMEQIKTLVADGSLAPGAKLPPERELMELLSVSRTSLREAIRILETTGLLRVAPGRGTYVCERKVISLAEDWFEWLLGHRREVVEILEVHEALEVKASELAATRITPSDVLALERRLDEIKRAVAASDHLGLVDADSAFHRVIHEAGDNQIISRLLHDLEKKVLDARRAVMASPSRVERVVTDHQAVFDAIKAGDAEAAARQTLLHVRRSKEELLSGDLDIMRSAPLARDLSVS